MHFLVPPALFTLNCDDDDDAVADIVVVVELLECPLVLENPPPAYPPPLRKKATALLEVYLPDLKHNFRFLIILADTELVLSSFFFYTSSLSTKMKICCCCYYCCCCKLWAEPVSYSCCASSTPISTEKMRLYTFPPFYPPKKYYVDTHCGWCRWAKYFLEMATILLKQHFFPCVLLIIIVYWVSTLHVHITLGREKVHCWYV